MRAARGFTLIELAISLAIIGVLLGMLIVPLNAQIDQQRINDTNRQLQLITEAIMGFAVANGRLPCPAAPATASNVANAGTEVKPGAACTLTQGVVPWTTLGVPEADAWGRRFTYRITPIFADNATGGLPATFTLGDNGALTVTNGAANIATNIVAVTVSHGKNGAGGFLPDGTQMPAGAGDEAENTDADNTFVAKTHDPAYDDLVGWVSPNVLKSRMVAANRLP
jgi:prepilin-type N-terminal cleavage/methylation domain-containing protein